jgi:hypothetical protein
MIRKKRARVAFRCRQELLNQIKQKASVYNMTMSCLIVRILSERLLSPVHARNDQVNPLDMVEQLLSRLSGTW